jgi:putative endonuclease
MRYCYVYVLMSGVDGRWYTGSTIDLRRRLAEHQAGQSTATQCRGPWRLIYYEASPDLEDAQARERYLKSGMGKRYVRNRLKHFFAQL